LPSLSLLAVFPSLFIVLGEEDGRAEAERFNGKEI
jgi:hypothetical protein